MLAIFRQLGSSWLLSSSNLLKQSSGGGSEETSRDRSSSHSPDGCWADDLNSSAAFRVLLFQRCRLTWSELWTRFICAYLRWVKGIPTTKLKKQLKFLPFVQCAWCSLHVDNPSEKRSSILDQWNTKQDTHFLLLNKIQESFPQRWTTSSTVSV